MNKFGRWTVIAKAPTRYNNTVYSLCRCACGKEKEVRRAILVSGKSKSCGCLNKEIITKHGLSRTKEAQSYYSMKHRCLNKKNKHYKNYGGRGITICERWLSEDGLSLFYSDMGKCPPGHTLERVKNGLGYSKENCVWANRSQQNINRRTPKNKSSKYRGVTLNKGRGKKWQSQIRYNGKTKYLGRYGKEIDAHSAFLKEYRLIYGKEPIG